MAYLLGPLARVAVDYTAGSRQFGRDPGAYSRPFTLTFPASLMPGDELMEYMCEENNQDAAFIEGPAASGAR